MRKKKLVSEVKQCGEFYLTVSIRDDNNNALEFDSLHLVKKCRDKPALSLKVEHRTRKVVGDLRRGTKNPFNAIGLSSISVENKVQNCTFAGEEKCNKTTDMESRWQTGAPEVVAFYMPLTWEETAPEDPESLLNSMGFKNGSGNTWYFNEPDAMRTLIQLGQKEMNMFEKPLFLHNTSIFRMAAEKGAKRGSSLGKIDLESTAIPLGAPWQGLLVVALDPLNKIPDMDRTDNVFVQYVTVNGTDESGNWLMDQPICDVQPVAMESGMFLQNCIDHTLGSINNSLPTTLKLDINI